MHTTPIESFLDKVIENNPLENFINTYNNYNENTIYVINPPIDGVAYVCEHARRIPFQVAQPYYGVEMRDSMVRIEQYWDKNGKSLGYKKITDQDRVSYPKTHVLLRVENRPNFVEHRSNPNHPEFLTYRDEPFQKKATEQIFPIDSDLAKFVLGHKDAINLALVYGTFSPAKPISIEEYMPGKYRVYDNINDQTLFFDDKGKEVKPTKRQIPTKVGKFTSAQKKISTKRTTSRAIKTEKEY